MDKNAKPDRWSPDYGWEVEDPVGPVTPSNYMKLFASCVPVEKEIFRATLLLRSEIFTPVLEANKLYHVEISGVLRLSKIIPPDEPVAAAWYRVGAYSGSWLSDPMYIADADGNFSHKIPRQQRVGEPYSGPLFDLDTVMRAEYEDREDHRYLFNRRGRGEKLSIMFYLPRGFETKVENGHFEVRVAQHSEREPAPKPSAPQSTPLSAPVPVQLSPLEREIHQINEAYEKKTAIAEAIIKAHLAGNARLTKLIDEYNLSPVEKRKLQDMVAAILNEGGKDNGPIRKL